MSLAALELLRLVCATPVRKASAWGGPAPS